MELSTKQIVTALSAKAELKLLFVTKRKLFCYGLAMIIKDIIFPNIKEIRAIGRDECSDIEEIIIAEKPDIVIFERYSREESNYPLPPEIRKSTGTFLRKLLPEALIIAILDKPRVGLLKGVNEQITNQSDTEEIKKILLGE